jgi:gliding motility-associated-like protein
VWIIKTDNIGNIQWQKSYGGSGSEDLTSIVQTNDGGYSFSATVESMDGNLNCSHYQNEYIWLVKLDINGNIEWQNCIGGNYGDGARSLLQTSDGGYIIAGFEQSIDLPGTYGQGGDGWVVKFDNSGNVQWQRFLGGTQTDELKSIIETNDGYIVAGSSNSTDGEICTNKGAEDLYIVKLSSNGTTLWKRTCGGLAGDGANAIAETPDGSLVLGGFTYSNDGDVSGNHSNGVDAWLVKLSFPGIEILPTMQISTSETTICTGKAITFTSVISNGGTNPSYQWLVNGEIVSADSSSIVLSTLKNGDVVSCILTSNSNCVTSPTVTSNTITVSVNPVLTPINFLPAGLEICSYGNLTVQPFAIYKTYLWNTNESKPSIIVDNPGLYWLQVTDDDDCPGKDTVIVTPKDCVVGFYMPSAFTPNHDGKNDLFKPVIGGVMLQYRLNIYNRLGQLIFQTTDPYKGWDGKTGNNSSAPQIFVWSCIYQLRGEETKNVKGTVTLIR